MSEQLLSPQSLPNAEHRNWVLCADCGKLQRVPVSPEHELICFNCKAVLHAGQSRWLQVASALAMTSLVLFVLSNALPFLTLEVGAKAQTATILDGFWALMEREQWILGGMVITTIFLFPLAEIFSFLYLLIPYSYNKYLPGQRAVLRWLIRSQHWSMLEIFMLSMVVASVKLADMAVVHLELGAYAFFLLVGVLILAHMKLNRRRLWSWINTNNYYAIYVNETLYSCQVCHAMVGESIIDMMHECPRCKSELHKRIPNSLQKTTALVIASIILYIPANVLPIMTYSTLGETYTDTIFSGVVELLASGLWGIALVVFVASIVVPITKLVILVYLLWAVKVGIRRGVRHRAFLFRLTEIIGRWSMVDVFVVTLLVSLVQFGFVYTVEPEGAIIAFGAVVLLTMVAAETFDPRLIWDVMDDKNAE